MELINYVKKFKTRRNNELVLYCHYYSYYSQKVLMVLYEKEIPFDIKFVNIVKGAQYDPWFLAINPRGEIPVLQDRTSIIKDSIHIIEYLEHNYEDYRKLIPDENDLTKEEVINFKNMIDRLPIRILTIGSFFHTEFVSNPKLPFIKPVRTLLAQSERNIPTLLRKYAGENFNARDILIQKAIFHETKMSNLVNKDEYIKVLNQFEIVFNNLERQLKEKFCENEQNWLCSEKFSLADISLAILLIRLDQLGYDARFWEHGIRPNITEYYRRVKQRNSYKKVIPNNLVHIKMLFDTYGAPLLTGSGFGIAVTIVVFLFLRKCL